MVHSEEEALGTRLTIDSLTCLLANETDPSKLLAISPGKLMRYLVPDEGYVQAEQPYAEIEVLPLDSPSELWYPGYGAFPHAQALLNRSSTAQSHAMDDRLDLSAGQWSGLFLS